MRGDILIDTNIQRNGILHKEMVCAGIEDDLIVLQELLLKNPKIGDVIPGASGIRKVRIPVEQIGKRSGGRVIYIDIEVKKSIYLLDVYAKNEKMDLTEKEKVLLAKLVKRLKEV